MIWKGRLELPSVWSICALLRFPSIRLPRGILRLSLIFLIHKVFEICNVFHRTHFKLATDTLIQSFSSSLFSRGHSLALEPFLKQIPFILVDFRNDNLNWALLLLLLWQQIFVFIVVKTKTTVIVVVRGASILAVWCDISLHVYVVKTLLIQIGFNFFFIIAISISFIRYCFIQILFCWVSILLLFSGW